MALDFVTHLENCHRCVLSSDSDCLNTIFGELTNIYGAKDIQRGTDDLYAFSIDQEGHPKGEGLP